MKFTLQEEHEYMYVFNRNHDLVEYDADNLGGS